MPERRLTRAKSARLVFVLGLLMMTVRRICEVIDIPAILIFVKDQIPPKWRRISDAKLPFGRSKFVLSEYLL
jgi:hypothetical protein